ncbi:anthrax toxin-like adenylyl cyclase domain-containing protein [Pseudomonas entomophila]|uniref:anthrax toxin-like adenylyl cyclase domain-containing protein n=1 Tax=Pseudomonas entomophila TaxID=312306 RepID=UPI002405992F|nr:anthrax toxin-like adenylyl cyclase domain-containing protein [Pseudomonas entomophila]MDF9617998.1 anthrax toxin-like adenylyl cyclase domain-containing protein [Pseudomonas entomophila]
MTAIDNDILENLRTFGSSSQFAGLSMPLSSCSSCDPYAAPQLPTQTASTPTASGNEGLQSVIEAVKSNTGVVTAHLSRLQAFASEHNLVIALRPVETAATVLIEAGHPTKSFHVKGKSSNWGPHAGMIPVEQGLSKLERCISDTARIDKFNQQVQACMEEHHAASSQLCLSRTRLDYLMDHKLIDSWEINVKAKQLTLKATGPSGTQYDFLGIGKDNGEYLIFQAGEPLQVLASASSGVPLTADYDLLLVAPHISDHGPQDKLLIPDVSHQVFTRRLSGYKAIPSELSHHFQSAEAFYSQEHPDKGNINPRLEALIPRMNQALVGEGEPIIHHSADSGNPFTDTSSNFPATFILPRKLGRFDEVVVVTNDDEMSELVQTLKNLGYQVPINPLWSEQLTRIRRDDFNSVRDMFNQMNNADNRGE